MWLMQALGFLLSALQVEEILKNLHSLISPYIQQLEKLAEEIVSELVWPRGRGGAWPGCGGGGGGTLGLPVVRAGAAEGRGWSWRQGWGPFSPQPNPSNKLAIVHILGLLSNLFTTLDVSHHDDDHEGPELRKLPVPQGPNPVGDVVLAVAPAAP